MAIPDITEYRIESNHRRRLIKQMKKWRWANAMDNRLEEYERRQQKQKEKEIRELRNHNPRLYYLRKKYEIYKNTNVFYRLSNNRKVPGLPPERPKSEIIDKNTVLNKNSINLSINSDQHV